MAIGEAASVSVHGSNRLGTNSLLDLVVFGRAAARARCEIVEPGAARRALAPSAAEAAIARFDRVRHAKGRLKTGAIRLAMQRAMQDHCSVFRSASVLDEGLRKMAAVGDSLRDLAVTDRSLIWNTDLVEALELDNLIGQAAVVLHLRYTAPKAAAPTPAKTTPSATTAIGSSTPSPGGTATAGCASATARCTSTPCPTRCRPSRQWNASMMAPLRRMVAERNPSSGRIDGFRDADHPANYH